MSLERKHRPNPDYLSIRRTLRQSLLSMSSGAPLFMPADTSIILATVNMQRSPTVWGEDAEVFNPDRWIDMRKEREGFMSWNYGPRMVRFDL
jgi:cytochrome P450